MKLNKAAAGLMVLMLATSAFAQDKKWGAFISTSGNHIGGDVENTGKTQLFVPIYQTEDKITFIDLRKQKSTKWLDSASISFGARKNFDDKFVGGANISYDQAMSKKGTKSGQAVLGLEYMNKDIDIKVNFYKAVTEGQDIAGTEIAPYAEFDGESLLISEKEADREYTRDGFDVRIKKSHKLSDDISVAYSGIGYFYFGQNGSDSYYGVKNWVSISKAFKFFGVPAKAVGRGYYLYAGNGKTDKYGYDAKIALTHAMEILGQKSKLSLAAGVDSNNLSGTQLLVQAGMKVMFGKTGKDVVKRDLDKYMAGSVSREVQPRQTVNTGSWSYLTEDTPEFDEAYSSIMSKDDIVTLLAEENSISVTEGVSLKNSNILLDAGRSVLVNGPNGEKVVVLLPENAQTPDGIETNTVPVVNVGEGAINLSEALLSAESSNISSFAFNDQVMLSEKVNTVDSNIDVELEVAPLSSDEVEIEF